MHSDTHSLRRGSRISPFLKDGLYMVTTHGNFSQTAPLGREAGEPKLSSTETLRAPTQPGDPGQRQQ